MIKKCSINIILRSVLTLIFGVIMISALQAQTSNVYDFRVIQLAADQIYLQAGNQLSDEDLPAKGDSLYIFRESLFLGTLSVMAVNSPRVVATFLNESFLVTRGEYLTVKWNVNSASREEITRAENADAKEPNTTSILSQKRTSSSRDTQKEKIKVSGRILTMANLTESNTRWSRVLSKSDTRWSSIPSANLSLRVQQLPGNWDLNLNGRYNYRMQTNSRINNTSEVNLYSLNAIKKWEGSPLEIQVGRFHNRYETNYSYWDGALIQLDSPNLGGGVSAGLEPVNSNEGIQTDFPKLGGFFHYQLKNRNIRYRGAMSMTTVFPSGYSTQINTGVEQRFDYKWLSLDGELQVDRDPGSGTMELTRLRVRTGFEITRWLQIRTNYQKRTPYSYLFGDGTFFSTREQYGVNATLKFGNWWFNNGVSFNKRASQNSTSYDTRIQWYRSPFWDLSWSLNGSYWDSGSGSSWNGGLSASKTFDDLRATAGATVYQVTLFDSDQFTGGLFFNGTKTINQSLSLSVRLQSSISQLMHRNSISVSLWKNF